MGRRQRGANPVLLALGLHLLRPQVLSEARGAAGLICPPPQPDQASAGWGDGDVKGDD